MLNSISLVIGAAWEYLATQLSMLLGFNPVFEIPEPTLFKAIVEAVKTLLAG